MSHQHKYPTNKKKEEPKKVTPPDSPWIITSATGYYSTTGSIVGGSIYAGFPPVNVYSTGVITV